MNIQEIQTQLTNELSSRTGWFEKYDFIISAGERLSPMDERYRTEEFAVSGCQSQLWIASELINGNMVLHGDSDAKITRGLVALLFKVLNNRTPDEVVRAELNFLDDTGILTALSPLRANGLASIISSIKSHARRYQNDQPGKIEA
ncbi:MAG: SufE family protein [Bacteroidetes bacterium]|nr:SufE family protein [Bacteroidota bacterium]